MDDILQFQVHGVTQLNCLVKTAMLIEAVNEEEFGYMYALSIYSDYEKFIKDLPENPYVLRDFTARVSYDGTVYIDIYTYDVK